jgi:superfamily II DNA or RNA helicase
MAQKSNLDTIVSRNGYGIAKSNLTSEDRAIIQKDLIVTPVAATNYAAKGQQKRFAIYGESAARIWVPRFWGIEKYGAPTKFTLSPGLDIAVKPTITLRPYQVPIVEAFMSAVNNETGGGGLICVPCGWGKTKMAIYIMSRLALKTIIVVHKEFLMSQWEGELAASHPELRIGKIQADVCKVDDCDIVIAMIQTIVSRSIEKTVIDQFGLAIFDECHHLGAEIFSQTLMQVGCKYLLGLSATPKRKDGLSRVFYNYIGPIIYQVEKRDLEHVEIHSKYYDSDDEEYSNCPLSIDGTVNMSRLITNIADFAPRTDIIILDILQAVKEGRTILILSDRKSQLAYFFTSLHTKGINVGYYIGGMKQSDLDKTANESDVMLATYAMAAEGMNIPRLNTLIFTSPKSDIEQSVGRILRLRPEDRKFVPLVIDYIDSHTPLIRQYINARLKFYRKNEYVIRTFKLTKGSHTWHETTKPTERPKTPPKPGKCLLEDW